ncbi:hypothetical protein LINGRAHAP2_LOCUS8890 [Linum grandiflorum]
MVPLQFGVWALKNAERIVQLPGNNSSGSPSTSASKRGMCMSVQAFVPFTPYGFLNINYHSRVRGRFHAFVGYT